MRSVQLVDVITRRGIRRIGWYDAVRVLSAGSLVLETWRSHAFTVNQLRLLISTFGR